MSKKIILNDNEVVFNEDVASAQNWRQRDFNRLLEAKWAGTFGAGPTLAGTVAGAAIISGLNLIRSATNLTVQISPGAALFGFGGTDTAEDNIYQMASSETAVTLALNVAHPTLTRWDIIEVSAEKVVTTETRKVLVPVGPIRRLVNTVVPKIEENRLKFRVRPGDSYLDPNAALTQPLQPDPAWLPLWAIRIPPAALTTSATASPQVLQLDLRLWLSNFSTTNSGSTATDGWKYTPQLSMDSSSPVSIFIHPNVVTIGGYSSPINYDALGTGPSRVSMNVNIERPTGLTYVIDRWYYVYAIRPHRNCGFCFLTISDQAPPISTGIPTGTRTGLPTPSPFPPDPASLAHYLGAIRLYDTGGGNFAVHNFVKVGNFVLFPTPIEPGGTPGASVVPLIVDNPGASGTYPSTINPGVLGVDVVPPHARVVRTKWNITTTINPCVFRISTPGGFTVIDQLVPANQFVVLTVDIPLSADGTTQYTWTASLGAGTAQVLASALGFFEDLP